MKKKDEMNSQNYGQRLKKKTYKRFKFNCEKKRNDMNSLYNVKGKNNNHLNKL